MALPGLAAIGARVFWYGFVYVADRMLQKGGWQGSERRQWQPIPKAPQPTPGAAIPVVFGTRWINSASVVWSGDLLIEPEDDREKFYLGMHIALCHAPIDALEEIKAEQIPLWVTPVTANSTLSIDLPEAFGGLEGEGGVVGEVDVLFGAADQLENAYLEEQLVEVPAFRGVVSVVAKQVYLTTTSTIRPWFFKVRMQDAGLLAGTAVIGEDINPARILELALTDSTWGRGIPAASLATAEWAAAWAQLATEEFGMSMVWDTSMDVSSLILNVLNHILGILYTDPQTGKITLKLIRQDYTPATLPLLDESNLIEIQSFHRPSLSELVNTVTIHYPDRDDHPQSITLHNPGLLAQLGGKVVSRDIHYDGVVEATLAEKLAARDLYNASTPLATVSLVGNRNLLTLRLGDPFRLSWTRYGLDETVFRVTWIDYGSLTEGQVTVHATEELRGLDEALYGTAESAWVDPINDPSPSPARHLYEAPYHELLRRLDVADMDSYQDSRGWLLVLAQRSTADAYRYGLATSDPLHPSGYWNRGDHSFCPVGALSAALLPEVETSTVFVRLADTRLITMPGTYCLIGAELCEMTAINVTLGTVTLKRGILDTVPVAHAEGARLWFAEDGQWAGYERRITSTVPRRFDGATVAARCLPMTSRGTLAWDDAPEDTLTMGARFIRPYPPGNFLLNTERWPAFITGDLAIAWTHRNRLTQITGYTAQDTTGIATEAGVTYTVRIYDENGALAVEETGLTGVEYLDYTVADEIIDLGIGRPNESLFVAVHSVRDGWWSYTQQEHTIEECRGYGMFYGAYYGE